MQDPKHRQQDYKSSSVAEMGDCGYNRHGPKRGEGCCAPFAGAGTPSSTMCLDRSLLPYQAASSSIQPFGRNRHGPKLGGGGCAIFVWGYRTQCCVGEAYLITKWHLNLCSRLATIDMVRKPGGGCSAPGLHLLFGRVAVSHLTQIPLG